jgi:hypothetical protein
MVVAVREGFMVVAVKDRFKRNAIRSHVCLASSPTTSTMNSVAALMTSHPRSRRVTTGRESQQHSSSKTLPFSVEPRAPCASGRRCTGSSGRIHGKGGGIHGADARAPCASGVDATVYTLRGSDCFGGGVVNPNVVAGGWPFGPAGCPVGPVDGKGCVCGCGVYTSAAAAVPSVLGAISGSMPGKGVVAGAPFATTPFLAAGSLSAVATPAPNLKVKVAGSLSAVATAVN